MILEPFSHFSYKNSKETIRKYITSRRGIAPVGKHQKPLGKHGFAATQKHIKDTLQNLKIIDDSGVVFRESAMKYKENH